MDFWRRHGRLCRDRQWRFRNRYFVDIPSWHFALKSLQLTDRMSPQVIQERTRNKGVAFNDRFEIRQCVSSVAESAQLLPQKLQRCPMLLRLGQGVARL